MKIKYRKSRLDCAKTTRSGCVAVHQPQNHGRNLTANEIEAANRAEATALLIRAGFRVYRPEADCYGEDLILRTPHGELLPVQLKGRAGVDWYKYGRIQSLWMLFPYRKT